VQLEHNLSEKDLLQASADALHAAKRSLLAFSGADGTYVRGADSPAT
jgi:hypothetical protein